jgi:hypothetical protein
MDPQYLAINGGLLLNESSMEKTVQLLIRTGNSSFILKITDEKLKTDSKVMNFQVVYEQQSTSPSQS